LPLQGKRFVYILLSNITLNFVAWVRKRTLPTKRPLLVGGDSSNFCG
jgi:hypothetical protein